MAKPWRYTDADGAEWERIGSWQAILVWAATFAVMDFMWDTFLWGGVKYLWSLL